MDRSLDCLFAERSRQVSRSSKWLSLMASGVLHAGLITAPILAHLVVAKPAEPIEFVAVQIVPISALGVQEPTPPPEPLPEPPAEKPEHEAEEPEPRIVRQPEEQKPHERRQAGSDRPRRTRNSRQKRPPVSDPARRRGSPVGRSLGTSTLGAPVGILDNPDFVYSYYVDQMLSLISAHWLRPSLGGDIEAMLHFRIHKDGRVSDLSVVSSSGYNSFDLAGLRAVQSAAPFPRLPQTYDHDSLGVNLILR